MIEEAVEYLVIKKLSGDLTSIEALKRYFINNESPSDIARELNISKFMVRGWIERIYEKCRSHRRAARVIAAVTPHVMKVDAVVLRVNGSAYCILCGRRLPKESGAIYRHVRDKHMDLVAEIINLIKRELG